MNPSVFPAFIKDLPIAEIPLEGFRGWLLQGQEGRVLFNESACELSIPEHAHGDQWGIVVDGRIDLTLGSETRTYLRGDSYFIPGGTPHKALIHPGFRAIDFFADRERYRPA